MKKKLIWWVLIILWCAFIFSQSAKIAVDSSKESMGVVTALNHYLNVMFGQKAPSVSEHAVRKSGHYLEYTLLGFLLFGALSSRQKLMKTMCISTVLGILYAASDEIHQIFVPGRTAKVLDVGIDTTGIITGILLLYLIIKRRLRARY